MYRITFVSLLIIITVTAVFGMSAQSDITVDSNVENSFIQVDSGVEEIIIPLDSVTIQSNIQSSSDPVLVKYNVTNERTGESAVKKYNYTIEDGKVSASHFLRISSFSAEDYPLDSETKVSLDITATHPEIGSDITSEEVSVVRNVGSIVYGVNNPNPTTLTDYQVKMDVPHRSGMGSDFQNIDFKQNDKSLPYWIEEYNPSQSATIWVKTNQLSSNAETDIELIFGGSVSGTESGSQVFKFYDGFTDGTIGSKWTDQSGADVTEENGLLKISTGNIHTFNRVVDQPGTKVEAKAEFQSGQVETNDNSGLMIGDPNHEGGNSGGHANVLNIIDDTSTISTWAGDGSTTSYNICSSKKVSSLDTDTPMVLGISDAPSSNEIRLYRDYANKQSCSGDLTGAGTETFVIGLGHFALSSETSTTNTHYDWVRTRKQAESEVSVSKK